MCKASTSVELLAASFSHACSRLKHTYNIQLHASVMGNVHDNISKKNLQGSLFLPCRNPRLVRFFYLYRLSNLFIKNNGSRASQSFEAPTVRAEEISI